METIDNLSMLFQYENLRDRSDAVPSFNDTPAGAPYLWNAFGLTRPAGDPIDHVASSGRDDLLMRDGQTASASMSMAITPTSTGSSAELQALLGDRLSRAGQSGCRIRTRARRPSLTTAQVISLFDAERDTDRNTFQQEVRARLDSRAGR